MIKAIVFAALVACGLQPTPATTATAEPPAEPDDKELPDGEVEPIESHWCCQSVDPKTKSGEGCTAFSSSVETINACAEYLHCPAGAAKHDGKVTCLD